jgi:hypothetical protein
MNIVEVATIALLVLSIGMQILIARGNARITAQGISHLDNSTAEALQALLEQLPETLKELLGQIDPPEPVNPIQMMIAQMLQERMKPPSLQVTEVIPQDPATGRFTKLDDF